MQNQYKEPKNDSFKKISFQRKKYQSVVQKGDFMNLMKSGAPEVEPILKSDPDVSKYETYQTLWQDGFKLKAIQIDGPIGKMLEDFQLK